MNSPAPKAITREIAPGVTVTAWIAPDRDGNPHALLSGTSERPTLDLPTVQQAIGVVNGVWREHLKAQRSPCDVRTIATTICAAWRRLKDNNVI